MSASMEKVTEEIIKELTEELSKNDVSKNEASKVEEHPFGDELPPINPLIISGITQLQPVVTRYTTSNTDMSEVDLEGSKGMIIRPKMDLFSMGELKRSKT